jgi:hypothetical protein
LLEADVLVVFAHLGFGRRREDVDSK